MVDGGLLHHKKKQRDMPMRKQTTLPGATMTAPDTKSWKLGEAVESADGDVKTYPLTSGGVDITLTMHSCLVPFDASSLNDGARKSLTVRVPNIWEDAFESMDSDIVALAVANSVKIFGGPFSEDDLRGRYKPMSQKAGNYPRQLRAKLVTEGFYACRCWDSEKRRIESVTSHAGGVFSIVLKIRGLWVSAESFGIVCDITDLQTVEVAACPF